MSDLLAMPEVLGGAAPISNVPQPTQFVPEGSTGTVATVQNSRTAGRAPSAVVSVAAENIPALRIVTNEDGTKTMSSLDIVDFINHIRKPGSAILRHDNFMAKVPTVLGDIMAPKFLGTKKYASGTGGLRDQAIYNFPRKEAIRMAMSYSYDLQAAVLDAWDEAEAKVSKQEAPVALLPNFDDPVAAAEAWIAERKQANVLKLELSATEAELEVAKPKAK
ncbi:hypothetical protein GTP45_01035 [Pseudoduganella sp. FT55W]|uniref:Uncharacterized protein n=1 Tax=Duganella rivi TaxID=2666083 RepID=A0A7X4GLX1_9BURK|nr:hypothetical protein [Duganella rivi]MYM65416.1 hypothetical protein [Duganella rivi]